MSETGKTLSYMLKTALKRKPGIFILYFLMLLAAVITRMQAIFLPKLLIDQIALIIKDPSAKGPVRLAMIYAGLTIMLTLLMNLINGICTHVKNLYREWFNEYFEIELADCAMGMDYQYTEDPEALDQLSRAKEGISWYSGGVVGILDSLYDIIMNTMVLFGVSAVMILSCPLLLPVQLLSLLVMLILNSRINRLKVEAFRNLAKSNRICGYLFYQLADIAYGKDIRLYDSTKMMKDKAKSYGDHRIDCWKALGRKQRTNAWGIDLSNALRDGCTYLYIGFLALKRRITIGDFSMYVSSASALYQSLAAIASGWQESEIEFSHVSFRYPGAKEYALHDINIKIRQGEHLSVVGQNGAGKTTFIKLICRLYDVTEGKILVDGRDIREYSVKEYRSLLAVIFQDFKLFAFSLKDNITAGGAEDKERLEKVLKLSGLYEDATKLNQGVDTILYKSFDEHGTELSGGQQQKAAISRALYRDAPIVILDEPTAALDPAAEYEIYHKFNRLAEGKTAIYISHRLSSCKFCDKIAVFAEGAIREYGTHEELIRKENGLYAEMFAAQAQYYVKQVS